MNRIPAFSIKGHLQFIKVISFLTLQCLLAVLALISFLYIELLKQQTLQL